MNVMHITYDMRIGGTEMVIKNLIEGNADDSINMSIFCIEAPLGPWGEELKAAGITITTQARQPGFDVKLIRAIRQHIKANHIDIVHCHQYTPWVYGALAAAFTKTKVIFTEHGRFYPDSSSWKRRYINPLLLKLTSDITAISSATKKAIVKYEFIPENKVKVIYNGIEPLEPSKTNVKTLKQDHGLTSADFIFGTVARLDPIKNQKLIIKALANVTKTQPNAKVLIVGDGDERESLIQLASTLGVKNQVIFTGYIPSPQDYIALMDVFLLPSFSEGTSMTLLEAMSLGKPCIVTDVGGNPEVISHMKTGLVIPTNDLEALTQSMLSFLENKNWKASFGKNALTVYSEKFVNNKMTAAYSNIYTKAE